VHCTPIPGDRIVGLRRPGEGIEVHAIDCIHLGEEPDAEWLDLSWGVDAELRVARMAAVVSNEPGSLATLTRVIAEAGANIVNVRTQDRDRHFHTYVIDLEVENLAQLMGILGTLRAAKGIVSAEREQG